MIVNTFFYFSLTFINGKPVIGEQKDIQEVKNAYKAYEQIDKLAYSVEDLKKI